MSEPMGVVKSWHSSPRARPEQAKSVQKQWLPASRGGCGGISHEIKMSVFVLDPTHKNQTCNSRPSGRGPERRARASRVAPAPVARPRVVGALQLRVVRDRVTPRARTARRGAPASRLPRRVIAAPTCALSADMETEPAPAPEPPAESAYDAILAEEEANRASREMDDACVPEPARPRPSLPVAAPLEPRRRMTRAFWNAVHRIRRRDTRSLSAARSPPSPPLPFPPPVSRKQVRQRRERPPQRSQPLRREVRRGDARFLGERSRRRSRLRRRRPPPFLRE